MEEIKIKLENDKELVAQLYDYDGVHPEIVICIQEKGIVVQDICIVRPHEEDCERIGTDIDCLVWGDEYCEDYTDKFIIPQYEDNASKYDKYDQKYPLLSLGSDPVILYDNLDEEDLQFVEDTLKEYKEGLIDLGENEQSDYFVSQDGEETFGGLIVEVLKWYKGIIGADDLTPQFVLPF